MIKKLLRGTGGKQRDKTESGHWHGFMWRAVVVIYSTMVPSNVGKWGSPGACQKARLWSMGLWVAITLFCFLCGQRVVHSYLNLMFTKAGQKNLLLLFFQQSRAFFSSGVGTQSYTVCNISVNKWLALPLKCFPAVQPEIAFLLYVYLQPGCTLEAQSNDVWYNHCWWSEYDLRGFLFKDRYKHNSASKCLLTCF